MEKSKEHLEPGEKIITGVKGAYETKRFGQDSVRNGVFLATDKRIIFFAKKLTGYDMEVFPYSTISSIEMGKGIMGHKITFFASGNKAAMKWIKEGNIQEFINEVKGRIGVKEDGGGAPIPTVVEGGGGAPIPTSEDGIPTQIKKLAELKDQGILSEEEFEAKKKELLEKM